MFLMTFHFYCNINSSCSEFPLQSTPSV